MLAAKIRCPARDGWLPGPMSYIGSDMAEETPNTTAETRLGDPCVMVIFGASGDLTKRKLLPTLYNLAKKDLVSKDFALIGFAIEKLTNDEFREQVRNDLVEFAG